MGAGEGIEGGELTHGRQEGCTRAFKLLACHRPVVDGERDGAFAAEGPVDGGVEVEEVIAEEDGPGISDESLAEEEAASAGAAANSTADAKADEDFEEYPEVSEAKDYVKASLKASMKDQFYPAVLMMESSLWVKNASAFYAYANKFDHLCRTHLRKAIRADNAPGLRMADDCYSRVMRALVQVPQAHEKRGRMPTEKEMAASRTAMNNAIEGHKQLRKHYNDLFVGASFEGPEPKNGTRRLRGLETDPFGRRLFKDKPPKMAEQFFNNASALFSNASWGQGVAYHNYGNQLYPYGSRDTWLQLGLALYHAGGPYNHALHAIDASISFGAKNGVVYFHRALILIKMMLWEEAVWSMDMSLRLTEKGGDRDMLAFPAPWYTLAYALHSGGWATYAVDVYEHVLTIDRQHADAKKMLKIAQIESHEMQFDEIAMAKRPPISFVAEPIAWAWDKNETLVEGEEGEGEGEGEGAGEDAAATETETETEAPAAEDKAAQPKEEL